MGAGKGTDAGKAPPHLVVAVSSRVLFDLDESHEIFVDKGVEAYRRYQLALEDEPLQEGMAFHLVRKLEQVQRQVGRRGGSVEVVLLSRNSSETGMRAYNSIDFHGLHIRRACFSGGENPHEYAPAFGVHLFLSSEVEDVRRAVQAGVAAAQLPPRPAGAGAPGRADAELRIAFDGDAVLFSDESQRIYEDEGLGAFEEHESEAAGLPLAPGPFRPFLERLHALQRLWTDEEQTPIRTALITARQAPSHKRVIQTLRHWGVRIDEVLFVGDGDKGKFVRAFGADAFFDDTSSHVDAAQREGVLGGHVPRPGRVEGAS